VAAMTFVVQHVGTFDQYQQKQFPANKILTELSAFAHMRQESIDP
jgi:hypothetical protein